MRIGLPWFLFLAFLFPQAPTAERLGVLPGISEPHSLHIVGDDLVFLDGFTVHVWSLDPLEPERAFAGQGEGPDQFRYWPRLVLQGDTIVGVDFMKTSFFSLQGELLGTIPYSDFDDFDPNMEMVLTPVGESFVRVTVDHADRRRFVRLFDRDLRPVRTLYEGLYDWQGALPAYRIDVDNDAEHIVVSDSDKGFFLSIFDTEGTLLRTIDKTAETEPIPFTDSDRAALLESTRLTQESWLYDRLRERGRFKERFPMINHVQLDGERLYVTTDRKRGGNHELLVLDLDGRVLNTAFLPLRSMNPSRRILRFDPYLFHDGKLYEIVRPSPDAPYELWVTDLDLRIPGG